MINRAIIITIRSFYNFKKLPKFRTDFSGFSVSTNNFIREKMREAKQPIIVSYSNPFTPTSPEDEFGPFHITREEKKNIILCLEIVRKYLI